MRYRRAVEKIRILAEACEDFSKRFPGEEPLLTEAYVFGGVLRGADPLEFVEVALVLNLPPDEVVWETTPRGTLWLADYLRLSKGGFAYFWRSHLDPVANHHIREPVRFWSLDGPDEDVLQALAERRLASPLGAIHVRIHSPLRGAAVRDDNWVRCAVGGVRVTGGWGLCRGRGAAGWAEGAEWWWRAARRHRFRLDRSRP